MGKGFNLQDKMAEPLSINLSAANSQP